MADPTPQVSVCMATYAGARYVAEQVGSILRQLAATDEVVIVDDASPDDTVAVVKRIADQDPRVRLYTRDENRGYVATFEEALGLARGEFLLLADQDDVWLDGRVAAMTAALARVDVVATNLTTLGGDDAIRGPYGQPDWKLNPADSDRHLVNIVGVLAGNRPYYGCAMGVRRSVLSVALPFPPWLNESHDLWLALCGNVAGSIEHLPQRTIARRLHDSNQTPNQPRALPVVVASRLMLMRCIGELVRRRIKRSRSAGAAG